MEAQQGENDSRRSGFEAHVRMWSIGQQATLSGGGQCPLFKAN